MQKIILSAGIMLCISSFGQNKTRPLTIIEYQKAKTFTIKDLDRDTYVKFENQYILDRYESKKPYFITGDDGLKKRIDLYKLIAKDSLQELGLLIFYTSENGKVYKACLPGLTAAPAVWEKYFEDIHAIDKEEKNFVLKLSYVLSKELGYQLYKSLNSNKDISREQGTYGNEICFPGDMQVMMANGQQKNLSEIKAGDEIITPDPVTHKTTIVTVQQLAEHAAKNYAITHLILVHVMEQTHSDRTDILLSSQEINATPNHPVLTAEGEKRAGDIKEGDELICFNKQEEKYLPYKVWFVNETVPRTQKVYNVVTDSKTLLLNGVMMLQKSIQ